MFPNCVMIIGKDLANIVRRRGHRVIANLLTNPTNGDIAPEIGSTDSKISSKASEEHFVGLRSRDQVIQYDMPGGFSLSVMQNKAHSELSKVQDIISTKNEELQAAEESLSGLKEVTLEYWGNGETVEVTGSFNGWQHRLKMDQQMPSKTVNPPGPREATLWSTVLWLYPGVYEIKFIVDGHWKIDPQREFVSKDNIVNNILRVDRDDDPAHRQTL
ncbi:unnamed protein product [Spirodela intermedia]|uniref:AMP-activated protein kinase glycogen-binding domain-containing protein n=1 Tax=Spirodela intermedia TaxID=51605 RepID=A0A7I8JUG1_SPIIN|nr:unnamed protein product [Spirodela intermedia]CAA6673371.1 unnamed protein product [Spirodela intermedia]